MEADDAGRAVAAARRIAELTGVDRYDAGIVLGTGWGPAAEAIGPCQMEFPVTELPGFLAPSAPGHAGVIRSTMVADAHVLVLVGRTHLYEGHGPQAVVHPIRTLAATGARTLVVTNANGSLRTDWPVGTGVLIGDHINFAGAFPVMGPPLVDRTTCWSPHLRALATRVDPTLVEGVYAFVRGPHYETAAEASAYRRLGADVIGMSGVLEACAARALAMDVLGLSIVSAIEHDGDPLDPQDVVRAAEAAASRLGHTIHGVLARLARIHH